MENSLPRRSTPSPAPSPRLPYDLENGADAEAVEELRRRFGENRLRPRRKIGFFRQFLANFGDPIIRILLGALAANILVSIGDVNWLECIGIAAAILIATLVSTISEYSSEGAFDALCGKAEDSECTVRRGGVPVRIHVSEIVAGDVVELSPGCTVPADGFLVRGHVRVDQSPLSGESEERKKRPTARLAASGRGTLDLSAVNWTPEAEDLVFRGSRVTGGEGEFFAVRVGESTFYGGVAADVQESARPSPLKERLSVLARSVSFLGYIAAGVIAFAYLFNVIVLDSGMNLSVIRDKLTDWQFLFPALIHALTVAISILVVAVPEGLPMMITVVLSSNMKKMLASGVLVRRLVGIETAGSMNILFTDKTGTLTCGRLRVARIVTAEEEYDSPSALRRAPAVAAAIAENHAVCAALGRGNATDRALSAFFAHQNVHVQVESRVPFDTARRYSSGCVRTPDGIRTQVRGAPEVILAHAAYYLGADGRVHRMTPAVMNQLKRTWDTLAGEAYRVLATAECPGANRSESGEFDGLIFYALIAIRDRLRSDAAAAVAQARCAKIQTVMITGDNPRTAAAIARECGIITSDGAQRVLSGADLAGMSDRELCAILPEIAVVARALPADKGRLVRLAQECGLVTGMTGDGINDAGALRAADVGFAMGSGTDAAREAADIVITDDRFSSIMNAVLFGRTVFRSICKFIVFQLTMNLCAVGVSLIGPFIGVETPVTVIQMLWVNIIMDTLGALAFAGEPPLAEYLHAPPPQREEKLLSAARIRRILWNGGYTLALCLWFLKSPVMHRVFSRGDDVYYLTVFFALFIFCGIFQCFLARADGINIFAHLSRNRAFIGIIAGVAAVQLMIIYFGGAVFRCEPLTPRELMLAALLASTVFIAGGARRILRRER